MNAVEVENLCKVYRSKAGENVALDSVSFQIPRGTIFGLLGPNGAGKTTAVKILTTNTPPTSGRAWVMGCA